MPWNGAPALHNGEVVSCRFLSGQVEMEKRSNIKRAVGVLVEPKICFFYLYVWVCYWPPFFPLGLSFVLKIWKLHLMVGRHGGVAILTDIY